MRLFDFFKRRRKTVIRRKRHCSRKPDIAGKSEAEIHQLQMDVQALKTALGRHSSELIEHKRLIDGHCTKLAQLEQIVSTPSTVPAAPEPTLTNRSITTTNQSVPINLPLVLPVQKHNIENFSQQEKRILTVFFQNPNMALSYVDVASALNKSPNTIKNQLRQLSIKANLFEKAIDDQNRNRFKLKDGLKIEQYLNIH